MPTRDANVRAGPRETAVHLALRLANNPATLAALKQKLVSNRATVPLFDTPRFTRRIETAYRRMWEIWAAGEEARAFEVGAATANKIEQ